MKHLSTAALSNLDAADRLTGAHPEGAAMTVRTFMNLPRKAPKQPIASFIRPGFALDCRYLAYVIRRGQS